MPSDTTALLSPESGEQEERSSQSQNTSLVASFLQRASYGAVSNSQAADDYSSSSSIHISSDEDNDAVGSSQESGGESDDDDDDSSPGQGDNLNRNTENNNSQSTLDAGANNNINNPRDGADGILTRRLRCLFSTITWPIVPLGAIVALALLWVLYAASSLDLQRTCSHPLHWYALASLILVAYIPHHASVRSHLFHYSRDRDGPIRPARVRMYDQFFHTICLLYVYSGVTLIQTCKEDIITNESVSEVISKSGGVASSENSIQLDDPLNSCAATCPNLYQALSVYVATLEMFTFALILPLLFLPCIYLWFLRRATAEAEAFAQLEEHLREETALLNNGGVTAAEIVDSLESVKLVKRNSFDDIVWLLPSSATNASIGRRSNVKECCICMSEFPIQDEADLEDGLNDENAEASNSSSATTTTPIKGIVRTRCGHVFHKECLGSWVGGRWQLNGATSAPSDEAADSPRRRARQTCCPLCREDLRRRDP